MPVTAPPILLAEDEAALPRILILSAANRGRSQMAAALWEALGGQARSAGTAPRAGLLPHAVAAMREAGLDIAQRRPRRAVPSDGAFADLVVLLDDVEPGFALAARRERWDVAPIDGTGIAAARAARDELRRRLAALAVDP